MPTMEKLTNEKGKALLGYREHIYTLEQKTDEKLIFRCRKRDCKGTCYYRILIEFNKLN
jgi:hypothetical protein